MNKDELIKILKNNLKVKIFEEDNPDYRYFQVRLYFGEELISNSDTIFL